MKNLVMFFGGFFKRYFAVVSSTLLALLVVIFILRMVHSKPRYVATIMNDDVTIIAAAIEKIDKDCSILSFEHERNFVDFLNIKSFVGSRVGSINCAYPENWKGPYIINNPTIHEKFYEVVKVKDGFIVAPGHGVKLPNGKVVGVDFKIDSDSIGEDLIKEGGPLYYKGKRLAAPLTFMIGDWDKSEEEKVKRMNELGDMLKRFNEAMPFVKDRDRDLRA